MTDEALVDSESSLPLIIRRAGPADIAVIQDLARRIWRRHYPGIISSEQIEYMLSRMYAGDVLARQMQDGEVFLIAEIAGQPVGYLAADVSHDRSIFLSKFYVDVDKHRRGIGRRLFCELLDSFPDTREIQLNVNRLNYKAVNAYFRLGFLIEGVQDTDFGNGFTMTDFRMVWKPAE